jgi:hypothetical protein
MVLLHKDGSIIELSAVRTVRPFNRNKQSGELIVEVSFTDGTSERYADVWHTKTKSNVSIYDVLLGEKCLVDWREVVKI